LLPGFFAGYVPWRFFGLGRTQFDLTSPTQLLGLVCIGVGVALLAACIFEFARSGRGTLSPVDAPRHLVVRGLYRYVRNPMYIGAGLALLGAALFYGSLSILIYAGLFFLATHLFVVLYEEPTLRRTFGSAYEEYYRQVRRWWPSKRMKEEG
jgi:protein-S-isoprenylcysteine O-methyltransferase Ste14